MEDRFADFLREVLAGGGVLSVGLINEAYGLLLLLDARHNTKKSGAK